MGTPTSGFYLKKAMLGLPGAKEPLIDSLDPGDGAV